MSEDEVRRAAARIAGVITGGAPQGWTRAVVTATAGPGGMSLSGGYDLPGAPPGQRSLPRLFPELSGLAAALGTARGWAECVVQIECRPSGRHLLTAFTDVVTPDSSDGFLTLLDPACRLPEPGAGAERGTAGPAGDPGAAAERFRDYLRRREAVLGRPEALAPPATPAELAAAEARIGHRLPADLRALYLIAAGEDGHTCGLFANCAWLSPAEAADVHADMEGPAWYGWGLGWDAVVLDADPPDTVLRVSAHPAWIPFATGFDGNYLAVDLAPGPRGRPGQVVRIGRDHDERPEYVADSVTSLLGDLGALLDAGAYEADEEEGLILLTGPGAGPAEEITRGAPRDLPPGLQALHVNGVPGPVDLGPLAAVPRLRRLHLNRCATGDLTPLRALPLESLRVTLDGGGLAPLAGHPHLAALDLGATGPLDLAPLRTLPRLRGLDLSRAPGADPAVAHTLPGLRHLALTAAQWDALLAAGPVPPGLASARVTGDVSLAGALTLAARLGPDTSGAVRLAFTAPPSAP